MKIAFTFCCLVFAFSVSAQDKKDSINGGKYVIESCLDMKVTPGRSLGSDRAAKPHYHSDSHHLFVGKQDLDQIPERDPRDVISMMPGVYQAKRGGDLSIGGSRPGGTLYIIDGVQIMR